MIEKQEVYDYIVHDRLCIGHGDLQRFIELSEKYGIYMDDIVDSLEEFLDENMPEAYDLCSFLLRYVLDEAEDELDEALANTDAPDDSFEDLGVRIQGNYLDSRITGTEKLKAFMDSYVTSFDEDSLLMRFYKSIDTC